MKQSESIKNLAAALVKAHAEMPVAIFDSENPFLHNRYASLGAVIQASRPILTKHGLTITQFPISEGDSVGIESMLIHESGEWISERILMPLGDEKGKSRAQVAGSIISYVRRYSQSAICSQYADEDTDGNAPLQKPPGAIARQAPRQQSAGVVNAPPAPAQAPNPKDYQLRPPGDHRPAANTSEILPRKATSATRDWFINQLGDLCPSMVRYLQSIGKLPPDGSLADLDLADVPTSRGALEELAKAMYAFEALSPENPPSNYDPPTDGGPSEPPAPDAWRQFRIPFGRFKDKMIADVEKNFLYGFWKGFTVDPEYKGNDGKVYQRRPDQIASDKAFRDALDAAGAYYGFK